MMELFPGTASLPEQSNKFEQFTRCVISIWLTNINVIPIDYASQPRLRDRLTLRRLTLRRNPWNFGDSVSHTICRYSCQHSHFSYLQHTSRYTFTGLENAPLPLWNPKPETRNLNYFHLSRKPLSMRAITEYSSCHLDANSTSKYSKSLQ